MAITPPSVAAVSSGGSVLTGVAAIAGTVYVTATTVFRIKADVEIGRVNAECGIPGRMTIPQIR